jgi:hypothetical protein
MASLEDGGQSAEAISPVVTHETRPAAALSFLVNFGVAAGREVTRTEVHRLAAQLLEILPGVTIVSEQRFESGAESESELHQVRVEVAQDVLPVEEPDIEALRTRLTDALAAWVESCVHTLAGAELTEAELAAREAVVDT